jgi:acyl-CoA oxidase
MTCSNFPTLYGNTTAACTYEGENTVMLLQTARYLMKAWQQAVQGKDIPPTVAYLKNAVSRRSGPQSLETSTASIVSTFQQMAVG